MLSFLPAESAGLLALSALVLLPGLVVVRSPWTAVPALSVAFWVLSWWWPVGTRSGFLSASIVLFGGLALLRLLPRHAVAPPPGHHGPPPEAPVTGPMTGTPPPFRSLPSLMVVLTALAVLMPLPLWPHAPGREMAFHTTAARLALWRDGLPRTYEPLFDLGPYGAHSPALPSLAADVGLLSGLDPGRSVSAASLLPVGLCLLGLYGLLATRLDPPPAALGALLGLAVAPRGFLSAWGQGGPLLALALGFSATALLRAHTSRPSAVAAGWLLAAALLSQPILGSLTALAAVWGRVADVPRSALATGVAAALAAPGLWRMAEAVSAREVWTAVAATDAWEVSHLLMGVGALWLSAAIAGRLGRLPGPGRVFGALLAAASAFLLILSVHLTPSTGQLEPQDLRALSDLADEMRPLEPVCAGAELVDWIPAVGGRPPGRGSTGAQPWAPLVFRDEADRSSLPPCSKTLDSRGSSP